MKSQIIKIGLVIMALTTMISMSACSWINDSTAKEVCDALEKKYGEEFKVLQIGDRLNTGYTKLYVCPVDNEDLVFTAVMYRDTGKIEDDYVVEKVNRQVVDEVTDAFNNERLNVYVRSSVNTNKEIIIKSNDCSPKELCDENEFEYYYVIVILDKTDCNADQIITSVENVSKEIGVQLLIVVYGFDTDNYEKCIEEHKKYPKLSETLIQQIGPYAEVVIKVKDGKCDLVKEEVEEKLKGK